jgi:hypothetical protein
MRYDIDPYVKPGDPKSGLLPFVQDIQIGPLGVDMRAGRKMHVLGEYSENNGYGVFSPNSSRALWAQSVAGENAAYPDGDWVTRSRIWRDQMNFVRGVYHFLRTDPSAPADLREKAETIGFQRGIFEETNGWPHQLYVREARRMKSDYVVTQKDLEGGPDRRTPSASAATASMTGPMPPPKLTPSQSGAIRRGGFSHRRLRVDNKSESCV